VISVQGSLADALRKRKKRASAPFFQVAKRTSDALCLLGEVSFHDGNAPWPQADPNAKDKIETNSFTLFGVFGDG
jgi:hypothetical protein